MTVTVRHPFRRMVLALPPDGPSDEAVRAAADLARVLETELFGLFLEEEDVFQAASLGIATEIVAGVGPRRIDRSRLEQDYRRTARRIERRVLQAAGTARLACRFDRVRGTSAHALSVAATVEDLVTVFEPPRPQDRATGAYLALQSAVFSRKGSALLMPCRISAPGGAIAVVAERPSGNAVDAAAAIARSLRAPLDIWLIDEDGADPDLSAPVGDMPIAIRQLNRLEGSQIARLLADRTRLLVVPATMVQSDTARDLLHLAGRHATPALVLAPPEGT